MGSCVGHAAEFYPSSFSKLRPMAPRRVKVFDHSHRGHVPASSRSALTRHQVAARQVGPAGDPLQALVPPSPLGCMHVSLRFMCGYCVRAHIVAGGLRGRRLESGHKARLPDCAAIWVMHQRMAPRTTLAVVRNAIVMAA